MMVQQAARQQQVPGRIMLKLLWLLVFLGSFVFVEPAPYEGLAIAMFVFLFLSKLRIAPELGFPSAMVALILLANIISLVEAHDLQRAFFYLGITFYLLMTWLMFACWVYADPDRVLDTIWRAYVVTAVISAGLGLLGYLDIHFPPVFFATPWGRAMGGFLDPNVYGPYLVPPVVYIYATLAERLDKKTVLQIAMALFITVGILISFSRAAWGNFVIAFVILGILRLLNSKDPSESVRKMMLGLAMGAVILLVLGILLAFTHIGDIFQSRFQIQSYDQETGGRFENMLDAFIISLNNPFGIGPGHSELDLIRSTHNTFLRLFVENGWLALLAYIALLVGTLWRLAKVCMIKMRHQRIAHVVFASLVGITINSAVIDALHWRHYLLILGIAWGLIALYPAHARQPLIQRRRPHPIQGARH